METLERIRKRAYDIYEARLYWNLPGDELSDWLNAEADILHVSHYHIKYDIIEEIENDLIKMGY